MRATTPLHPNAPADWPKIAAFVVAPVLALVGCGSAVDVAPTAPRAATTAEAAPAPTDTDVTPAPIPEAPPPPPTHVRWDLAAHPDRLSVRDRETQIFDLGAPQGEHVTLGGWTSGVRAMEIDGVSAAVSGNGRARLILPSDGGPTRVVLRARAFRGRRLFATVGDTNLPEVSLPTDGSWQVVRYDLPALPAGEHRLILRVRGGAGRLPTGESAALAIDWMRVGPSNAPSVDVTTAPPTVAIRAGSLPALRVPPAHAVDVLVPVPAEARLRGVAAGGPLTVSVHREGASAAPIEATIGNRAPFDLDLAEAAGEVVRVRFMAGEQGADIVHPAVVVSGAAPSASEARRPRNVLLYLVDTLRADHLQPYNAGTRVRTPGLMRFVENATTMRRAHTQECWTKPSVATLLSSLMPWEHTAVQDASVVPRTVRLLPEHLREQGFTTASFIANGYVSDRFGFGRGWDSYRNYIREGRRTQAEYVAADVLQWLDAREDSRPFFLYVHTIDPHVPYRRRSSTFEMYGDSSYRGIADTRNNAELLARVKMGRATLRPRDRAHLEALYDGEITYHDVHFQTIMDGLARRHLADDTLVIVTSDHGEEFWDHGSVGHGHSVYEELVHVPMFVRHPGLPGGARELDDDVGLVDVVPTILDAVGAPEMPNASGRSFLPSLRGVAPTSPRGSVSGFMENWRSVALGRYKLIHRANGRYALYDLQEDPGETNDVAGDHPLVVRMLRAELGLRLAESTSTPTRRRRRRPRHRAEQTEIDDETAAQLRALGYMVD